MSVRGFVVVEVESIPLDRGLLWEVVMLFGRLRVPFERAATRDLGPRTESGLHSIAPVRGDSPQRPLALVPPPPPVQLQLDAEFEGLDRLDREELDED
jgi:hypothetical protein